MWPCTARSSPGGTIIVLDADGQQFLGFLREGGRRLATLVNDLLAYTRAGMAEITDAPVDASAGLEAHSCQPGGSHPRKRRRR